MPKHFNAEISINRVLTADSLEEDQAKFRSSYRQSLIGLTVGRLYIALMHAKYLRISRKLDASNKRRMMGTIEIAP